jgi:hypothetical protein
VGNVHKSSKENGHIQGGKLNGERIEETNQQKQAQTNEEPLRETPNHLKRKKKFLEINWEKQLTKKQKKKAKYKQDKRKTRTNSSGGRPERVRKT